MEALLTTYGVLPVVLILIIGIPLIIRGIKSIKNIWQERTDFAQANVDRGRALQAQEDADKLEHKKEDNRLKALEDNIKKLTSLAERQQEQINLLIQSDKLDIKAWIKIQHDTWVPKGYIDSQVLDLLEERYAIYRKENGNSWAEKMMVELRALPTIYKNLD